MSIQIIGVGHALPERVLGNQELEAMVDTSNDWIVERTGINTRRICAEGQATSDLCYEAAVMALENAGIAPTELDLIVVGTSSPDMLFPSTACLLQYRLGASRAAAFDLEAGCSGFIYALGTAEKFLLSDQYSKVLVLGADLCSRFVDYTDRNTCIIFGDGAGAAVLSKGSSSYGIIASSMGADGSGSGHLFMPAGGSLRPPSHETVEQRLHSINMNGPEVFKFASAIVEDIARNLLETAGMSMPEVDVFIPHQANIRIIRSAVRRCGLDMDRTLINIDKYGNMSAASIPVALSEGVQTGEVKEGDIVLMAAFGAGLTYGGVLMRWGRD